MVYNGVYVLKLTITKYDTFDNEACLHSNNVIVLLEMTWIDESVCYSRVFKETTTVVKSHQRGDSI